MSVGVDPTRAAAWARTDAVRTAWRFLATLGRGRSALAMAGYAVTAVFQRSAVIASGVVVDRALAAAGAQTGQRALWVSIVVLLGLWVGQAATSASSAYLQDVLVADAFQSVQRRVMAAANRHEGLGELEDPAFARQLVLAQGGATGTPPQLLVGGVLVLVPYLVGYLLSVVLVARVRWWLPIPIVASMLVQFRWFMHVWRDVYGPVPQAAEGLRRYAYLWGVTARPEAAKELRVFGFGSWVMGKADAIWDTAMQSLWSQRSSLRWEAATSIALTVLSTGAVAGVLAHMTWTRQLTVGEFTATLGLALSLGWTAGNGLRQWQLGLASVRELEHLEAWRVTSPADRSDGAEPDDGVGVGRDIVFEDVTFAYPGTSRQPVLEGLDLRVQAGTSLAIVGRNGAGKTTLVKLLGRLYEPQAGSIRVDGNVLSSRDVTGWRRSVSVILQDFLRLELTVRDNIVLDAPLDSVRLEECLERAGISDLVASLPAGLDTVLSRAYTNGVDLSGGQWQRLALARALYHSSPSGLLILDEPTAALDVRAEARFYDEFLDLTRGLTTIVISHRFSTVRRAEHIAVLEDGRVVEYGSHDELMALNGRYHTMFSVQAERFNADEDEVGAHA